MATSGSAMGSDERSVLSGLDWAVIVVHMVLTVGVGAAISYFSPTDTQSGEHTHTSCTLDHLTSPTDTQSGEYIHTSCTLT
jgi:hypothetical protein